jgi:hypothetical protein
VDPLVLNDGKPSVRTGVEHLDRQRWTTRIELADAIFDYIEIWHNPETNCYGNPIVRDANS